MGQPPDDEEDSLMLARLRGGDRQVFAELVHRHREYIQRVVRGYVRTDEEAEDLTQQTFLRALRAMAGFRGDSSVRTWLHRIAVNGALNLTRNQRRVRSISIEEAELITTALGTARMAAREARRKLAEVLEKLPPKQRLVVELRIVHEMPFRAIASVAGCSEDSAKANFQHAVKKLREWALGR